MSESINNCKDFPGMIQDLGMMSSDISLHKLKRSTR
jgi:hypothetical protein